MNLNFDFQNVDKEKIIMVAGVALGTAALVLSLTAKSKIDKINDSIDFDKTVDVEVYAAEDTESEETSEVSEEEDTIYTKTSFTQEEFDNLTDEELEIVYERVDAGETLYIEDDEEEEEEAASSASFNLVVRDGSLKLVDSTIRLEYSETDESSSSTIYEDVYVYLDGENTVEYDSTENYVIVNENIIVKTISADDASYNGIAQFQNSEDQYVIIGERQITEDVAIAVVYTLDKSASSVSDDDISEVQNILNGASTKTEITSFTLFGTYGNTDWLEDVIMTNKAVELIKGTSQVYISPYSGSFADGTTNDLVVGDIELTYCESAMDTSTGYIPYIYEFTEDQGGMLADGSSTDTLKVKILATSNGIIKGLFD